jgi:hypothetical protein
MYEDQRRKDTKDRIAGAKNFLGSIEQDRSLVFYYANYSNPFNIEDTRCYVVVGVSRVKKVGDILYYENCSPRTLKRYGGFVWQCNLTSHYPDQGFRIPYHLYMDNQEILDKIVFVPSNPRNFKYVARIVSDDDALGLIEHFLDYEIPLYIPDGTYYLPDFTVSLAEEVWYWEHRGRIDEDKYPNHWQTKKAWYDRFFPGRLLTTKESGDLTEPPLSLCQGVLVLLVLSLSCDRASCKVCQTFKPTDSGVENIRTSERIRSSFARCYSCLRLMPSSGHCSTREPGKRREKWYALDRNARAFTQRSALLCNPQTRFSCQMYYQHILAELTKSGNAVNGRPRSAARRTSPRMNARALRRNLVRKPMHLLKNTFRSLKGGNVPWM